MKAQTKFSQNHINNKKIIQYIHTIQGKINKKINRSTSAWKTLSLNRKDKVKNDNSQIFRSPSIYENNPSNNSSAGDQNPDIENNHDMTASDLDENKQQNTVMNRYLSGKFCPLTPSQQPTNVSHLVEANEKGPVAESGAGGPGGGSQGAGGAGGAHSTALVPASPTLAMTNYCSIM